MVQVPKALRHCRSEPRWDDTLARAKAHNHVATQREVAAFVAVLADAGRDCRTKLAAIDKLLVKVEARAGKAPGGSR